MRKDNEFDMHDLINLAYQKATLASSPWVIGLIFHIWVTFQNCSKCSACCSTSDQRKLLSEYVINISNSTPWLIMSHRSWWECWGCAVWYGQNSNQFCIQNLLPS